MNNELELISKGDETEKIKTYVDICEIFTSIMGLTRFHKGKAEAEAVKLGRKMTDIGFKLIILAPDDVVHSFFRYQATASQGKDSAGIVKAYGQLLLDIRKDMVPDTTVDIDTVLDAFPIGE